MAAMPRPAARPLHAAACSPGAGPSHQANTAAATSAATKAVPNTCAGCRLLASTGIPVSRDQALRNSGPYQMPPSTNADTAAATTANQFSSIAIPPGPNECSCECVRFGREADAQRALADVDHAGQAHHRFMELDVVVAAGT